MYSIIDTSNANFYYRSLIFLLRAVAKNVLYSCTLQFRKVLFDCSLSHAAIFQVTRTSCNETRHKKTNVALTTGVAMHSNEANLHVLLQCWKRKMRLHRQFHQSHLMVARPLWFQRESGSDIYHTCLSFIFLFFSFLIFARWPSFSKLFYYCMTCFCQIELSISLLNVKRHLFQKLRSEHPDRHIHQTANFWTCSSKCRGFESRPFRFHVTTFGKMFTRASVTKQYNLVPVKRRWCPATEKVTISLALHWPCVTDFSRLSTYGLTA